MAVSHMNYFLALTHQRQLGIGNCPQAQSWTGHKCTFSRFWFDWIGKRTQLNRFGGAYHLANKFQVFGVKILHIIVMSKYCNKPC